MRSLCLAVARFCAAAWCGAGLLFVLLVIGLRGSPLFDNVTKLNHPRILFPIFYRLEFALLSLAVLSAVPAIRHPAWRGWRATAFLALLVAAWLAAIGDYTWIYRPLTVMLELTTMPPEFARLHLLSRWVNTAGLACCLTASFIGLWPKSESAEHAARDTRGA